MTSLSFLRLVCWLLLSAFSAWAAPTVIIDAGHGGHDRGGMPGQPVEEKGYTLDVARRVQAELRRAGYATVMTRTGDYFVELEERSAMANRYAGRSVFVSIHFNGAPNPDAHGIETYYAWGSASARLAQSIHYRVLRATGEVDRRIRSRSFSVLRRTRMPAVLCELGFLTNRAEVRNIQSSSYRQRLAEAIVAGIRGVYR
jgi:N-acetylmuramoyl-L-alanine amidase